MNGEPPRKPKSARRVAFAKWAFVGAIAGAALISACSQPSDTQQAQQQQQPADEQARKEADEKAWADAEKAGTVAGYTAYLLELRRRRARVGGEPTALAGSPENPPYRGASARQLSWP